jgi:cytochrome c oxidase assembly factor CtaG
MILGLSLATFTLVHVIISLIGIATGLVVLWAMIANKPSKGWTEVFLVTTVATSVTGFFFPLKAVGPPHIVGGVSLIVLVATLYALYGRKLTGPWRAVYVITATIALYLNSFVGVAQSFTKIAPLKALEPTGTGPIFGAAQLVTLALFVWLGFLANKRFHPAPTAD